MKATCLLAPLLLAGGIAQAGSPDSHFMKSAARGGMSEVEIGLMAKQRANEPVLRDFAAQMINDHSDTDDRLKAIAVSKGVALPEGPSAPKEALIIKLNLLSGEAFDKAYIIGVIDDHRQDIKSFQEEAVNGKDADVRAFARSTLSTLQAHLKNIESIAATPSRTD